MATCLARAALLAMIFGLGLIALQAPIATGALAIVAPSDSVEPLART